jgi:hypothetical protein
VADPSTRRHKRLLESVKNRVLDALPASTRHKLYDAKDVYLWLRRGRTGSAPHLVKRRTVRRYARRFGATTLIETGTFKGDMVATTRKCFRQIFSIELHPGLAADARKRFAGDEGVSILQGDSAKLLNEILDGVDRPALFWLDAHYSGGITARGEEETPILDELRTILKHPITGHVLLIDDAREFGGSPRYPTIAEVQSLVMEKRPALRFTVASDIIRIHP